MLGEALLDPLDQLVAEQALRPDQQEQQREDIGEPVLDPATGTGTFLVEVIDLIHKRMVETWKKGDKSAAEIKAARRS